MTNSARSDRFTPEGYMLMIFSSKAARDGAVIRRKASDIEKYIGMDRFQAEIARRGYRAYFNAGQIVIFCNQEPVVTIVDGVRTELQLETGPVSKPPQVEAR